MTRTPQVTHQGDGVPEGLGSRLNSKKILVAAGAGLALAGAGAAAAAAVFAASAATVASPTDSVHRAVAAAMARQELAADTHAGKAAAAKTRHADHTAAHHADTGRAAVAAHLRGRSALPAQQPANAAHRAARPTAHAAHAAQSAHAAKAQAGRAAHAAKAAARPAHAETWPAITKIVAKRTYPGARHGSLPAADRLTPVGTTGPQAWLPMTTQRWDNAATIVRQSLAKHMGLRSAVIAIATAMQESTLVNVGYGTSDSLGLFQQRPSMGWGTAQQVMNPAHSADAFLQALRTYQANNPGWSHQPLWQSAQGVQASAFPYAYAKWEAQAAHVVQTVTGHMV